MADPQVIEVTKGETKNAITIGAGSVSADKLQIQVDADAYTNKSGDFVADVQKCMEVALEQIAKLS